MSKVLGFAMAAALGRLLVLVVASLTLASASIASARCGNSLGGNSPGGNSLTADLTYDAASSFNPRVSLKDPVDHTVYTAELMPEIDNMGRHLIVDLVLFEGGRRVDGENLVEPQENWHGIEPFMFAAWDLAKGRAHSLYGPHRFLPIIGHRSALSVDIRQVRLAQPIAPCASDQCVSLLDISIAIANPKN